MKYKTLTIKKLLERFMKKNGKRKSNRGYAEKAIKIKNDKLYGKRKGYDNLLNSWIDKVCYRELNILVETKEELHYICLIM